MLTMTEMTAEQAAAEIRRAYSVYALQYGRDQYMSTTTLSHRVDLTHEQISDGIRHLVRTDRAFYIAPESNLKVQTDEDRAAAVWVGGQWKHLLLWER